MPPQRWRRASTRRGLLEVHVPVRAAKGARGSHRALDGHGGRPVVEEEQSDWIMVPSGSAGSIRLSDPHADINQSERHTTSPLRRWPPAARRSNAPRCWARSMVRCGPTRCADQPVGRVDGLAPDDIRDAARHECRTHHTPAGTTEQACATSSKECMRSDGAWAIVVIISSSTS